MKIIALEAENVKHLKAISIKPDGSLVVIGGENGAGKTCVLDCIQYGLGGASSIPSQPIRVGQKKARILLNLDDILVTRTFTAKGTKVIVKNKEGATFPSPQAMLEKLLGDLTFDPLEFSRMDSKKQAEVLKKLVGLDFDKLNANYKKLFDERTVVNRRGKELKATIDNMEKHEGVPDKEISVTELSEKYKKALEHNQHLDNLTDRIASKTNKIEELEREIKKLQLEVKKLRKELNETDKMVDVDAINKQMIEAEKINTQIRENRNYAKADNELNELRKQSQSLSDQINDINNKKAKILAEAKFPIKGLAIDEDEVTFDGIPFVQCSTAQQIKISVAIGLAMNPKLRILLIREGSLLDKKNLAMIAKMADEANAQIWLERVGQGKECSVIIEDGEIQDG